MKFFKIHGMLLSFFLAFVPALLFNARGGYAHEYKGFSHDEIPDRRASQVDPDNMRHMKEFLLHSVAHLDQIVEETGGHLLENRIKLGAEEVKFLREMRVEATWVNLENNVYLIHIITQGGLISNHPRYPVLYGRRVEASADSALNRLMNLGDYPDPFCLVYDKSSGRVACGIKYPFTVVPFTLIAGFDHATDDEFITETNCAALTVKPNARDVYEAKDDQETVLKNFVRAVTDKYEETVNAELKECPPESGCGRSLVYQQNPFPLINKIYLKTVSQSPCLSKEDGNFRYESIYPFIMALDANGTVIANGKNPELNGLFLLGWTDKEGNNIADVIRKAARGNGGKGGFVTYYWSNPELMGSDATPNWFEEKLSPGTSLKKSYVKLTEEPFPGFPFRFIVGSGIYPATDKQMMPEDDDGGACAIAGTSNTPQSALLNLFLVASVLFSVVFLRRRA